MDDLYLRYLTDELLYTTIDILGINSRCAALLHELEYPRSGISSPRFGDYRQTVLLFVYTMIVLFATMSLFYSCSRAFVLKRHSTSPTSLPTSTLFNLQQLTIHDSLLSKSISGSAVKAQQRSLGNGFGGPGIGTYVLPLWLFRRRPSLRVLRRRRRYFLYLQPHSCAMRLTLHSPTCSMEVGAC